MNIRQLYSNNVLSPEEQFSLNTLANEIKQGRVILFLGAAVHCPPPDGFKDCYKDDERPPSAAALAGIISDGLPDDIKEKNLSWIAQYYESVTARRDLVGKIRSALNKKTPSPLVYALAEMNFNYILTTNYDDLFEKALIRAGKTIENKGVYKPNKGIKDSEGNSYPPEPTTNFPSESITTNSPFIYKVHGDIADVYQPNNKYNSKNDAIVITDEDYIHFILRMGEKDPLGKNNYNPIPTSFTKALAEPEDITVLFIGYSLLDYNLRLLFKSAMWKKDVQSQLRKWSVDLKPDRSIKDLYKGLYTITFIEKDAWIVVPYLYERIFNQPLPL